MWNHNHNKHSTTFRAHSNQPKITNFPKPTMGPENDVDGGILLDSESLHSIESHQAESSSSSSSFSSLSQSSTTTTTTTTLNELITASTPIDTNQIIINGNNKQNNNIKSTADLHSTFSSTTTSSSSAAAVTLIGNGKSNCSVVFVDSHAKYSKLHNAASLPVNSNSISIATTTTGSINHCLASDTSKMIMIDQVNGTLEDDPHLMLNGYHFSNIEYRNDHCQHQTTAPIMDVPISRPTPLHRDTASSSSTILCQSQFTPNGCQSTEMMVPNQPHNNCGNYHRCPLHNVNSNHFSSTQSVSHYDHNRCDQTEQQPMDFNKSDLNDSINSSYSYNHTSSSNSNGFGSHAGYSIVANGTNGTIVRPPLCSNGIHKNGTATRKSTKECGSSFIEQEEPPYHIALLCYFNYAVLILFGYIRDFMCKIGLEKNLAAIEKNREGYPQIYKSFESFYTRNIYRRIRDAWNCPIASVPGAYIDVINRVSHDYNWSFEYSNTTTKIVNMGSYNYLGFAENCGPIHSKILQTIKTNSVGICSTNYELGTSQHVRQLEEKMAQFLGTESCAVFGMGFATNSTNIQCFAREGCLVMSDELNHASLCLGCKLSGATVRVFRHNDMNDLDRKIRKYIIEGQPKTGQPWKKIIILVEGIYSMEGTIVDLPRLIEVKNRYKCYIYLDEAHSIGALGPNGRGVIDYFNCDPNDIDILMGTFSKSFDASGGYIAGKKKVVDYVRSGSFSGAYGNSMSPIIAHQIYCVVQSLTQAEGIRRIRQLARNTKYFRKRLNQMGFIVFGNEDSPVVPVLIGFCSKIAAVIRAAFRKGLGFIGAGYPATRLTGGRVRFCVSASHTLEILDRSLVVMDQIGDDLEIKYSRKPRDSNLIVY